MQCASPVGSTHSNAYERQQRGCERTLALLFAILIGKSVIAQSELESIFEATIQRAHEVDKHDEAAVLDRVLSMVRDRYTFFGATGKLELPFGA